MPDPLAGALLRGFDIMVRRELRGVWLAGDVPPRSFVWAGNHHSWWDPFLAAAVLPRYRHVPCLLMEQANIERYGFLRRLGVFGTGEYRRGVAELRAGRVLVIYPEGELRPAGQPGELAPGAVWYALRAGVPLYAVATRVVVRGHEAPEGYLWLTEVPRHAGPPRATARDGASRPAARDEVAAITRRLADRLAEYLAKLDAALQTTDPRRPPPGFRQVIRGRRSWDERIDAAARWWPWVR